MWAPYTHDTRLTNCSHSISLISSVKNRVADPYCLHLDPDPTYNFDRSAIGIDQFSKRGVFSSSKNK